MSKNNPIKDDEDIPLVDIMPAGKCSSTDPAVLNDFIKDVLGGKPSNAPGDTSHKYKNPPSSSALGQKTKG